RGGVEVGHARGGGGGVPVAVRKDRRPDDDAAVHRGPRGVPSVLPPPARAGGAFRPARALDGHEPGLPGGSRRRGHDGAAGVRALHEVTSAKPWDLQTFGTERSSTSGSPRRTTSGTRTATSRRRTSSAPTP